MRFQSRLMFCPIMICLLILPIVSGHITAEDSQEIGRVREVIMGIPEHNVLLEYYIHWIPNHVYENYVIANLTYTCSNLHTDWYFKISKLSVNLTERIYDTGWAKGDVFASLIPESFEDFRFYNYNTLTIPLALSIQYNLEGDHSYFLDVAIEVDEFDESNSLYSSGTEIWQNDLGGSDCPVVDFTGQMITTNPSSTTPPATGGPTTGTSTDETSEPTITGSGVGGYSLYDSVLYSIMGVSILIIVVFSSRTILFVHKNHAKI